MDLLIVLNPTAGPTAASPAELEGRVRARGHDVRVVTTDDVGWMEAVEEGSTVVAAGGDGTVRRVALAVAGTGIPFTVLPLGTANNIARVLGLDPDDVDGIIGSWSADSMVDAELDVPTLEAGEHGGHFIEAVGGALVADIAHLVERRQDHGADLLAVEVLNTPTIGPGLRLADADACDGQLDVVLVRPRHRERLAQHATSRLAGSHPISGGFDVHRGTEITIQPPAGLRLHRDDHHWVASETCTLHVSLDGLHARVVRRAHATDLTC